MKMKTPNLFRRMKRRVSTAATGDDDREHDANCKIALTFSPIDRITTSTTILGYRTTPLFWVNGQRVAVKLASQARPNQTLLSFLRDTMGLTGSKLGCAEGGCGACTVMVSKLDKESKTIK